MALGAVSKMLPRIEIIHIPNSIDTETENDNKDTQKKECEKKEQEISISHS